MAASQGAVGGNMVVTDQSTQKGDKRLRCRVNRQLLPLKMFYFFFYGASGSIIPFIPVYLKHLRMSVSEVGLITGLSMLAAMLMRAVIGMVADKTSARKTALLVCVLGFGAAFFAMWFVPHRALPYNYSTNSTDNNTSNMSMNSQQQPHDWICWTSDGHEICRYPARVGYPPCKIGKRKSYRWYPGNQPDQEIPALATGGFISIYIANTKSVRVNVTINSQETDMSGVGEDGKDRVSRQHFDQTAPCFYVSSEIVNPNIAGYVHQSLTNEHTTWNTVQREEVLLNSETVTSSTGDSHRMSTQINGGSNDVASCLLNCTSRLVNGSGGDDVMLNHPINSSALSGLSQGQGISADLTFVFSFLLLILGKSFYATSTSLADAVTYTILGPYSLKWGQQRLWGTVGTAVTVLSITLVNDRRQVDSFMELFIALLGLTVLTFLIGFFKLRADRALKNKTFFKDVSKLLCTGSVRLFLAKLMFYGLMAGTVQNFTFWFLVDIGGAQITLGVCLLLYCASSIFMLRYSRLILHKLGHLNVLYITLVAYAIRFLVLSFLTNAWLALPAEILHGVTYSLFWAAASSTASIVAPPGTQATSQGLAGAVYLDLGRGVGIIVSGQLLQLFGVRWTFRAYSVLCVAALPVLWLLDRIWRLPNAKGSALKVDKEQEGETVIQLLQPDDFPNNNGDNKSLGRTVLPTSQCDLEITLSTEKELRDSELTDEEESAARSPDLETIESHASGENTRPGENNSGELSHPDIEPSINSRSSTSQRNGTVGS